jgi:hypothetical protein
MGSHKQRERRQVVFLAAQLRSDGGWSDITICNISSRGVMAKSAAPPPKGAFVEVRRGGCTVVGHVRWSQGSRFGLRSQTPIDLGALCDDAPKAAARPGERHRPAKAAPLPPPPVPAAARWEKSRRLARFFDWLILAGVGIGAAGLVAQRVSTTLAAPLQQTRSALAP